MKYRIVETIEGYHVEVLKTFLGIKTWTPTGGWKYCSNIEDAKKAIEQLKYKEQLPRVVEEV
jgi:phosphoenolpyruvate carboxylase